MSRKKIKAKAGYELETSTCVRLAPSGFLLKLLLSRFSISDYHLQCVCIKKKLGLVFDCWINFWDSWQALKCQ